MESYAPNFLIEEDAKTFHNVIQPSLNEGKPLMDIDLHVKKKDGGIFHSLWSYIPLRSDNNEYFGFTAIGLDLTEIDKLRDELIKKEKIAALMKLKEVQNRKAEKVLYETIPNPVITFDQNNKIVDCNQQFLDKFGYSKDEIMEWYAPDFLSEEDAKTFHNVIQPSLNEGRPLMDIDLHVKKKDGSTFHLLWSHIRNLDNNNEYLGFTAIGLDLTEIDKLRDELVKKEKLAIVGKFAGNLAHDMRNPLFIIQMSLENLRFMFNPNKQKQLQMKKIERAINRMTHQIDSVLDFVQDKPLTLKKVSMTEIINEVLCSVIIPTNIELILPKNNIEFICDKEKFSVLLYNIVFNAIQSIVDSGTIKISVEEKNDEIIIQIQDSGVGISKDELDIIFDPLFTTKLQGTGLGLVSAKSIIESHGGIISVTSPPTIFTITLPKISD